TLGAVWLGEERVGEDIALPPGAHLRVYLQPIRFAADEVDWRRTILHESADFLVVNKPGGVPVHATVDNWRDNVLFHVRGLVEGEVLVTHRLDTPVSGLLVLARTPEFQRCFNSALAEGRVTKHYRALVEGEPSLGGHTHYLDPDHEGTVTLSETPRPSWL